MWFIASLALVLALASISVLVGDAVLGRCGRRISGEALTVEAFCLSSIIGTAVLMLAAGWLSWAGAPMRGWGPAMTGVLVATALFARHRNSVPGVDRAGSWGLVALLLLPGVFYSLLPLLRDGAIVPYGDTIPGISLGEFLQEHGFRMAGRRDWHSPFAGLANLFHRVGLRMGVHYLLGLVQSWAPGARNIEVFPAVTAWGTAICTASCFLLARWVVRADRIISLSAAVAVSAGVGTMAFSVHWGVMNQLFGIGLLFAFLVLQHRMMLSGAAAGMRIIPSAIMLAALVSGYSELLPFAGLIAAGAWCARAITRRRIRLLFPALLTAGLMCLLSNIELVRAAKAIHAQMGAVPGGHVGYSPLQFIATWIGTYPGPNDTQFWARAAGRHPAIYNALFALGPLVACLSAARLVLDWRRRRLSPVLLATVAVFAALWIKFAWLTPNPWIPGERGQTWSMYKLIQYGLPLGAALLAAGFKRGRIARRLFPAGVALFAFAILPAHDRLSRDRVDLVRDTTGTRTRPLGAYEALVESLRSSAGADPVRLVIPPGDPQAAIHIETAVYYLATAGQPFSVEGWHNGSSTYFGPYEGYAFTDDPRPPVKILLPATHVLAAGGERVPGGFVARRRGFLEDVTFDSGWSVHERDSGSHWHRWAQGAARMTLHAGSEIGMAIDGSYSCARPDQRISITYNGRAIGVIDCRMQPSGSLSLSPLCAAAGDSVVEFQPDAPPVKLGADPRDMSFSLADLSFNDQPAACDSGAIGGG